MKPSCNYCSPCVLDMFMHFQKKNKVSLTLKLYTKLLTLNFALGKVYAFIPYFFPRGIVCGYFFN